MSHSSANLIDTSEFDPYYTPKTTPSPPEPVPAAAVVPALPAGPSSEIRIPPPGAKPTHGGGSDDAWDRIFTFEDSPASLCLPSTSSGGPAAHVRSHPPPPPPRRLSLLMLDDALQSEHTFLPPLPTVEDQSAVVEPFRATSPTQLRMNTLLNGPQPASQAHDPNRSMSTGTKWHASKPPVGSSNRGHVVRDEDWSDFQAAGNHALGTTALGSLRGRGWSPFGKLTGKRGVREGEEDPWEKIEREHRESEERSKSGGGGAGANHEWEAATEEFRRPVVLQGWNEDAKKVMTEDIAQGIRPGLPPRFRFSSNWTLLYSLDQDGTSIERMYELIQQGLRGSDSGIIVAVKDQDGDIFGAYASEGLRPDKSYYGDGTCFLWKSVPFPPSDPRLIPPIRRFHWTSANPYLIYCEPTFLSFGGGKDGKYGLWIDGYFQKGFSSRCECFGNEPLTREWGIGVSGTEEKGFEVLGVEVWAVNL